MTLLPSAASLDRTRAVTSKVSEGAARNPAVSDVLTIAGYDLLSGAEKTNAAVSFVTLKDWSERRGSPSSTLAICRVNSRSSVLTSATASWRPSTRPQSRAWARRAASNFPARSVRHDLAKPCGRDPTRPPGCEAACGTRGCFHNLHDRRAAVPGSRWTARKQAHSAFRSPPSLRRCRARSEDLYVNDFGLFGRTYRVTLSSEANFRRSPEDLRYVFVRSNDRTMVPLSALLTVSRVIGPDVVDRFNGFRAARIQGNPAPGFSSGQAIAAMQQVVSRAVSRDFTIAWTGSSYQELESAGAGSQGFLFGIVMVFLILAAQYERWSLPLAVIAAVPFAVFGAILAIYLRGIENDVYFQVGLITLIGLAAKNAILVVEFAAQRQKEGLSVYEAAVDAAKLRFRPIVMTSLAFILGAVPLAISTGAGSGSRHSVGTGVIGGMVAATFVAFLSCRCSSDWWPGNARRRLRRFRLQGNQS